MSEREENLNERGTHGGPSQQRKIRGLVERTCEPEEHPGRKVRHARANLAQRRKDAASGSGRRVPGSLKTT